MQTNSFKTFSHKNQSLLPVDEFGSGYTAAVFSDGLSVRMKQPKQSIVLPDSWEPKMPAGTIVEFTFKMGVL
ncbi:MAG: hypothetical protein Q7T18_06335 [Sedimentisphaerales bacterium]|nr:hypothetical protein [Sedimentisphaerales bacterium]